MDGETGIFLSLDDCVVLFPRLKENEASLSNEERLILLKMEKILYGSLSIHEIETLLEKASVPAGASVTRRK
jgi:hypothetical protein